MQPVKRPEIIAASPELDKRLAQLDTAGVSGYCVISNVAGQSYKNKALAPL
ncbi:MAG: hypothetical protein WA885_01005 [Phormidesmis sp.]